MRKFKKASAEKLYAHFQRKNKRPPVLGKGILLLGLMGKKTRSVKLLQRITALRLPVFPLGESSLIPIEVLIVVAPKDFDILPFSIEGAVRNSGHPVSKIVLIVPNKSIEDARVIISPWATLVECEVVGEDSVISEPLRDALHRSFKNRYGWILQQLLCVAYVSESKAAGVLLVDSDTVLTTKRAFLNTNRQLLMVSLERHDPYYDFLKSLSPVFGNMENTFVTHHMIENPSRLREILEITSGGEIKKLVEQIITLIDHTEASAVCVDFELYAQAMFTQHREEIVLAKWSNIAVPRAQALSGVTFDEIQKKYVDYCSVSFHSYT